MLEATISKPKAPAPPDPIKVGEAQTGTNIGTAIANSQMGMINQVTPDGRLTYSQSGATTYTDPSTGRTYQIPQFTATTELSPEAQAIRDQTNRADLNLATLGADQSARAGELLSRPMDLAGAPAAADRSGWQPTQFGAGPNLPQYSQSGTGLPQFQDMGSSAGLSTSYGPEDGFSADRQRVEDMLFDRLQGQRDRDYESLRTQLVNQGVNMGTEAYSRAMEDFDRNQNEMRMSAMLGAGQEQSRLAGLARDQALFGNTALQQEFANAGTAAGFNNNNQAMSYSLAEDQRRYGDAMQGQQFSDAMTLQGRDDALRSQQFNQQGAIYDAQDNARSRALQEQVALRNQPINEITALLSGSQVQTPQFGIAQPAQIPTTDMAGIMQQGYANQMANYQAQRAPWDQAMGGLFGLGSSYLIGR